MSKASAVRINLVAIVAVIAAFALSASASAQVTVGQVAPSPVSLSTCMFEDPYDELQRSVGAGASYVVPTGGVLTSWSVAAGANPNQLIAFKVFRPLGGVSYLVVGVDGPRLLTPNSLNTFPVSIPVQAGDVIGTWVPANSLAQCAFVTGLPTDTIGYREGNALLGGTFALEETFNESRLNVSASLLPPPVISSISPAKGSIKGTSVVIAGANFASVQGVSFGSVPATSFTVNSEGQITATAPPSKTLSKVPVTVTTVAGAAASPQTFVYEGCKVPSLGGKKLKASKKKAKKADCKIGKVTKRGDATAKTGKVVKQNPKPGKILAPGTKIKVTLGD